MALRTYLDHNASAPLLAEARDAMMAALALTGNASSVHREGRSAHKFVEDARTILAGTLGVAPKNIVFTAGATEAANLALSPAMRRGAATISAGRLYVSSVEHPCVLAGGRFAEGRVARFPVNSDGVADLDTLSAMLAAHDQGEGFPLVALMLVNNETGVIQPVREAAEIVHARGGLLVVDAVQAFGRLPLTLAGLGADFLLLSAHKIGGPQGAGALVLSSPSLAPLPLVKGGGQENFHRAGTENVAAIAGFGAAIANIAKNLALVPELSQTRDWLEAELRTISKVSGVAAPVVFGERADRVANTVCFAVPGISAETALIALDLDGVAVSSGSACSSGKVRKSHVLEAMGAEDGIAGSVLRLSFGPDTTRPELERFLAAWAGITGRLGRKAA